MLSSEPWIYVLLSGLATQLPTLLASGLGLVIVGTRWKTAGAAAKWALTGFLILLVSGLAAPVTSFLLQQWIANGSGSAPMQYYWIFAATGFAWSALHGLSLLCLLMAIFAGRPRAAGLPPPGSEI